MLDVYIQKWGESFASDFCYSAYEGFTQSFGLKKCNLLKLVDSSSQVPKKLNLYDRVPMFIGQIDETISYLKRWNINIPGPITYPIELREFLKREVKLTTLGEFKSDKSQKMPIFIKPFDLKIFPAGVVRSDRSDLMFPDPDDTKVWLSDELDIISEWRGFVVKGKLIGLKHYTGDFKIFPSIKTIDLMINSYKSCPSSYTLDVGVTSDNDTILVECNDGWSVGSYGLEPELVVQFLINRWIELTKI